LPDFGEHACRFTAPGCWIHENASVHSGQSYRKQKRLGNPGVFLPLQRVLTSPESNILSYTRSTPLD
jgi:hypothetical protein